MTSARDVAGAERIAVDSVVASPATDHVGVAPGRRCSNKLVHKNRWLISVDVVASLRRAGVDCDILVPGGEPWREKIGWSPGCRPH